MYMLVYIHIDIHIKTDVYTYMYLIVYHIAITCSCYRAGPRRFCSNPLLERSSNSNFLAHLSSFQVPPAENPIVTGLRRGAWPEDSQGHGLFWSAHTHVADSSRIKKLVFVAQRVVPDRPAGNVGRTNPSKFSTGELEEKLRSVSQQLVTELVF